MQKHSKAKFVQVSISLAKFDIDAITGGFNLQAAWTTGVADRQQQKVEERE